MIFIIIYIYLNLYLCIYTPSYQHFKAFPVSKFNSETSFLYQLFNENINYNRSKLERSLTAKVDRQKLKIHFFFSFNFFLNFYFIYLFMYFYVYTPSNQHFIKPSWCLNPIPRPVFFINFSRRIQIS